MSATAPEARVFPVVYTLDVDGDDLVVTIERGNSVGFPASATWRGHRTPAGWASTTFNGYCEHEIAAKLANELPTGVEFVPDDFAVCECEPEPEPEWTPDAPRYPHIEVELSGGSGNAGAIMGAVSRALRRAGVPPEIIDEYRKESMSGDYDNLLHVATCWVDVS